MKNPRVDQYDHPAYKAYMKREKEAIAREMKALTKELKKKK